MFIFNFLEYLIQFEFTPYIFVGFLFAGVMLLCQRLVFGR